MASVHLWLEDGDEEDGDPEVDGEPVRFRFHIDPPPLDTSEERDENNTVAQINGMALIESILGRPLVDEDFMAPTYH